MEVVGKEFKQSLYFVYDTWMPVPVLYGTIGTIVYIIIYGL